MSIVQICYFIFKVYKNKIYIYIYQCIQNIDLLKDFYKLATGLECANYDLNYVYDNFNRSAQLFSFHTCFNRVDINILTMNDINKEELFEKIKFQILPDLVDTYNSN